MCNIWKQKKIKEVTPEEVAKILSNSLFQEVTDVGINGGEPTLRRDIGKVASSIINSLPKLKTLHLITNAIIFEQVISAVDSLSNACQKKRVNLNVMVSLDGIGSVHDGVRGRKGNFESAKKVIDSLRDGHAIHNLLVGCTVVKANIYDCENVLDWCDDRGILARFRIAIPHKRLYSLEFPHPTSFTIEEKFHFGNFLDNLRLNYEKSPSRRAFYLSLRDQVVNNAERSVGCSWQYQGVTLTSRGELAYCAVESPVLGECVREDPESLYWDNQKVQAQIIQDKCKHCLHDYSSPSPNNSNAPFARIRKAVSQVVRFASSMAPALLKTHLNQRRLRRKQYLLAQKNLSDGEVATAKQMETKPLGRASKFLLCGWYGTETLGDKAILAGVCSCIADVFPDCSIELCSLETYVSEFTIHQLPEAGICKVVSIEEALARLKRREYDAVVMAGGPIMSPINEVHDIRDLFHLARRAGLPAIVAGCGLGPLGNVANDKAISQILELSSARLFRDKASATKAIEILGDSNSIENTFDPAFVWLKKHSKPNQTDDKNRIVLALRDWPVSEYAVGIPSAEAARIKGNFEREILKFVQRVKEIAPETDIVPFCMHKLAVGGNDRLFYRRIFKKKYPEILEHLDHKHRDPTEDFKFFCESRAILAMRFHSVVFSLGAHKNFHAIDYTMGGKVHNLLKDLNIQDRMSDLTTFKGTRAAEMLIEKSSRLSPEESQAIQQAQNQVAMALKKLFSGLR